MYLFCTSLRVVGLKQDLSGFFIFFAWVLFLPTGTRPVKLDSIGEI